MERSDSEKDTIFYEKIAEDILYKFFESLWFGKVKHKKTLVSHEGKKAVVEHLDPNKISFKILGKRASEGKGRID